MGPSNELGLPSTEQGDVRREPAQPFKLPMIDNHQPNRETAMVVVENNVNSSVKMENELIDLNSRPQRMHGQTSNNQVIYSNWKYYLSHFVQLSVPSNYKI